MISENYFSLMYLDSERHFHYAVVPKRHLDLGDCQDQITCRRGMDDYKSNIFSTYIVDLCGIIHTDQFKMWHAIWLTGGESLITSVPAYKLREGNSTPLKPSSGCRDSSRCDLDII